MLTNSTLDKLLELIEVQGELFEKNFPESNELEVFNDVRHELEEEVRSTKERQPADKVVATVMDKLVKRSHKGVANYGRSMERDDLSEIEWLQHHHEELMDAAVYVQKLIDIKLHQENQKI